MKVKDFVKVLKKVNPDANIEFNISYLFSTKDRLDKKTLNYSDGFNSWETDELNKDLKKIKTFKVWVEE